MKVKILFGLAFNLLCMFCVGWLMLHASLSLYLLKMGRGQLNIILHTEKIKDVLSSGNISEADKNKLILVDEIKNYSVDSLGYKRTKNFTTYFDQKGQAILWVVTACEPFKFKAYEWKFPMLGKVSYKGFFNKVLAQQEFIRLLRAGYDADLSTVSAWSTLGWLPDPILSSMLRRSKGKLANLLFHELFHATYYAKSTVEVNENLANFVAHKATVKYLQKDTGELKKYLQSTEDDSLYKRFIFSGYEELNAFYKKIHTTDTVTLLKEKEKILQRIYARSTRLDLRKPSRYQYVNKEILSTKNAFFMGARRYDGLYDSLNRVLHVKYNGDLKRMIEELKKRK